MGELKWLMISLGDPNSFEASVDKLEELCDEIFYLPDIFIETILEMVSCCGTLITTKNIVEFSIYICQNLQ